MIVSLLDLKIGLLSCAMLLTAEKVRPCLPLSNEATRVITRGESWCSLSLHWTVQFLAPVRSTGRLVSLVSYEFV